MPYLPSGSRALWFGPWFAAIPGFGPAPGPIVGVGRHPLSAFRSLWTQLPDMQALTSDGNLWHKQAPEELDLPYATFFLVSEVPEIWTTAYPWLMATIQVNCHAMTDEAALDMALTIRSALGKSPAQPSGAPLIINGAEVTHVLPAGSGIDIGEGLGPRGRDCWVAFETFEIPWTPLR